MLLKEKSRMHKVDAVQGKNLYQRPYKNGSSFGTIHIYGSASNSGRTDMEATKCKEHSTAVGLQGICTQSK